MELEEAEPEEDEGADRSSCAPTSEQLEAVAAAVASVAAGADATAVEEAAMEEALPPDPMADQFAEADATATAALDAPRAQTRPLTMVATGPLLAPPGLPTPTPSSSSTSTPAPSTHGSIEAATAPAGDPAVQEIGALNDGNLAMASEADAERLLTQSDATEVVIGSTLHVKWDSKRSYHAVVHHLMNDVDGHIVALVDYDDGSSEHVRLVLNGPAPTFPWSEVKDDSSVLSRVGKNTAFMFRGRLNKGVVTYAENAKPEGVFAITLDGASLTPRLYTKLRWDEVIWSTRLANGGSGLPDAFDMVATYYESTVGNVRSPKDIYIVLGYANPIETGQGPRAGKEPMQLVTGTSLPLKSKAAFLVVIGVARFQRGPHIGTATTKLQEGGRFLKAEDVKNLPVDVLPLDGTRLLLRKTESIAQLSATIGCSLMSELRERFCQWELLQQHMKGEDKPAHDQIFQYFQQMRDRTLVVDRVGVSPLALILGHTMVETIAAKVLRERENLKAAYTAERQKNAYALFDTTVKQVVHFLGAYPSISGMHVAASAPVMVGLCQTLMTLKPQLQVTTHGSMQDQMLNARNRSEQGGAAGTSTDANPAPSNREGLRKRQVPTIGGHTGMSPPTKATAVDAKGGRGKGGGKGGGRGGKGGGKAAGPADPEEMEAIVEERPAPIADTDPSRRLFATPLSEAQHASDVSALKTQIDTLTKRVQALETDLSNQVALTAAATAREENLKGSVTQLEAAATSAATALETERSRADQLATSATESAEKDKQIEALKDAIDRLEKEKQTWQCMLGCQMNLDTDKFNKLMNSFNRGSGS